MAEQAERLCEFPFRESVGGEAAVYECQAGSEVIIAQIGEEAAQLSAGKHTFIYNILG